MDPNTSHPPPGPAPAPRDRRRVFARVVSEGESCSIRPVDQRSKWTDNLIEFLRHALAGSERARALADDEWRALCGSDPATPGERRRILLSLALDPTARESGAPELPAGAITYLLKERTRLFVALPDGEPFCLELLLESARPIRRGRPKSKEGFSFPELDEHLRRRAMQEVFALERDCGSTLKPQRFLVRLREVYARLGHPLPDEVTTDDLGNELKWAVGKELTTYRDYRERPPGYNPAKLPKEQPE